MKKVKISKNICIDVVNFDDVTNKKSPYYQSGGSRYASCPFCNSVVNIKGGYENKKQSTQQKMYASHHGNEVEGFELKDYKNCPFYQGNKGNWQGVYQVNKKIRANEELQTYIENNKVAIAAELSDLTGISFKNQYGVNTLFDSVYESFILHNGLCRMNWHPEMVSHIILINAATIKFWGYKVISEEVANIIRENSVINSSLGSNNQFKSNGIKVSFIATMNNNDNPEKIHIKLVWDNSELVLKTISAKIL